MKIQHDPCPHIAANKKEVSSKSQVLPSASQSRRSPVHSPPGSSWAGGRICIPHRCVSTSLSETAGTPRVSATSCLASTRCLKPQLFEKLQALWCRLRDCCFGFNQSANVFLCCFVSSFEVCRRGPLNRDVTIRPPLAVAWAMVAISEAVSLVHQSFSPRCTTTAQK